MAKKKAKSNPEQPTLTYREAQQQLEQIVASVENEELDVDELSEQVQRAMELITFCRTRLRHTEKTIQQAFEGDGEG